MNNYSQGLITAFINIRGQTGLPLSKQLQIDQFIKDTFSECNTIISHFSLIVNNSQNRYGTSSLVKNEFGVENIVMDKEGRIIIFDVGDLTFGNMYIHSGTDSLARGRRENYFSETVPQLLINHKDSGFIGGDLNCIIEKEDATNNPESKISPSLKLSELKQVHPMIKQWYDQECSKIALQSKSDDSQTSEKIRIYHHEIHQKIIKKSAILKLETENGLIEGHKDCAAFLENSVAELLHHPAQLDHDAQQVLLGEVDPVFTDADNKMLCAAPTKDEVKEVLWDCNQHAAPGTDGLTVFLYRHCWDTLGDHLVEVSKYLRAAAKPHLKKAKPSADHYASLVVLG